MRPIVNNIARKKWRTTFTQAWRQRRDTLERYDASGCYRSGKSIAHAENASIPGAIIFFACRGHRHGVAHLYRHVGHRCDRIINNYRRLQLTPFARALIISSEEKRAV
jgi:hypothetical protein